MQPIDTARQAAATAQESQHHRLLKLQTRLAVLHRLNLKGRFQGDGLTGPKRG